MFTVIQVASASTLSTGLVTEVLPAYIVVVPTGVIMLFTYFITKAATSLYSRGQQSFQENLLFVYFSSTDCMSSSQRCYVRKTHTAK